MRTRSAYLQGRDHALAKYALTLPVPGHRGSELLDLAGLGLIAAPVVHSTIYGDKHDSEATARLKHISDLAGLGLLAYKPLASVLSH